MTLHSLSSRSAPRLHLVHEVDDVVLLAERLQPLEPLVGPVVVSTLSLNQSESVNVQPIKSLTCIGSTMTPVTGHPLFSPVTMASSAIARHLSSSASFSLDYVVM